MTERQILRDAINIRSAQDTPLAEAAAAFGVFALQQMAAARFGIENFASASDLETFGHRLLRFNAFWTTHNKYQLSFKKSAQYR
jgi:hypothetical protein